MTFRLAGMTALLLVAAACSRGGEDTAATGSAYATDSLSKLPAREWARCWFDVAGDSAKLSCAASTRGADPLTAIADVTATPATGASLPAANAQLDLEDGGEVTVGTFPRAAFPMKLSLAVSLTPEANALIGQPSPMRMLLEPTVATPEEMSKDAPAVMTQPFELWQAAFIDVRTTAGPDGTQVDDRAVPFVLLADQYTHSIAPYRTLGTNTTPALAPAPVVVSNLAVGVVRYYVAPAGGSIAMSLYTANPETEPVPVALTGPGYYAVTNEGLVPANPEQIARDFVEHQPPPPAPTEPAQPADPRAIGATPTP